MLTIYHTAVHDIPTPTATSTAPTTSTSTTSTSNFPSSSSTPSSADQSSLANVNECSWIKVVVPHEKPAPRRYQTGVLHGGKLFVFGGVCVKTPSNDFYSFDFQNKKWTLVVANGTPPTPRCGHSAIVFGGKMRIFGGHDNNRTAFSDLYTFDFASSTWEKKQPQEGELWPSPRYHHSATLIGSSIFVVGGCAAKSKYFNDVFVYKLDENKWELLPATGELPEPRAGHLTIEWKGNLYIFGGYGGEGGYNYFVDTHAFEIETRTFREFDCSGVFPRTARPLSYAPYYFGDGENKEGAVYVFGGSDGKNPLGSLFQWNLKTNKWKIVKAWMAVDDTNASGVSAVVAGKLDPIPRYGHCTVLDGEGVLTIFGGSGSLFLDDVVQFDLNE